MRRWLLFVMIGLAAQLVDGALGMAYGVTSSSLLLVYGLSPAAASASVHLAELATTATSGIAHWRFGNVDANTVRWLAVPGCVGAFTGALLLSAFPGDRVKPYVAAFLFLLGAYIMIRFARGTGYPPVRPPSARCRHLAPLGLIGGLLDAIGGGGWGPITTPTLLVSGHLPPHKAVGSASFSEFGVALSATLGFVVSLGWNPVQWLQVGALVVGGTLAAPLGAWLARRLPAPVLGVLVGSALLLVNLNTLCAGLGITGISQTVAYGVIVVVCFACQIHTVRKHLRFVRLRAEEAD